MNFSFRCDGRPVAKADLAVVFSQGGETVYAYGDLRIAQTEKRFENGAAYSLLRFENTGGKNSSVLSEICDIDEIVPLGFADEFLPAGYHDVSKSGVSKLIYTRGAVCNMPEYEHVSEPLYAGGNHFTPTGGRSCRNIAPFFEADNGMGRGVLLAVGWTGQWFAHFQKEGENIHIRAGVDGLSFYLKPKEKIRTASVLLLPYDNGTAAAHNAFRRIMVEHFSVYPNEKLGNPPLSMQTWGGAKSEFLKRQIQKADAEKLGFEYFWVDAGWYGNYEEYCPDEFVGKWGNYTGDWQVNRRVHPGGLKDVFSLAKEKGMKGLLWFEPERVCKCSEFYKNHREMVLECKADSWNSLLNLAKDEVKEFMLETISRYIEELGLSCYRQDFNFDPLPFWNEADEEGRKGITQIRYITALYEILDTLRARFPHLVIDNCASGGNRIDIEMCSRSIPLWRSDTNCDFDFNADYAQNQQVGLSAWVPYHGCGTSRFVDDVYKFRSCHGAALASNFLGYEAFGTAPYDFDTVRFLLDEYKSVRHLFAKDFYPVFGAPLDSYAWSGWQFHDSETEEGVVEAFRRPNALQDSATVYLGGLKDDASYEFFNSDTKEKFVYSGKILNSEGFTVVLKNRRSSALFRYKALKEKNRGYQKNR